MCQRSLTCTASGAPWRIASVRSGPVAAHDPRAGMLAQPGRQCGHLPVGKDVDAAVCDGVEDQGCVAVPAPQGEVVHTEHFRHRSVGCRHGHQRPQHGGA